MKTRRLAVFLTSLVLFSFALGSCTGAVPSPTPSHGGCPAGYSYNETTSHCETHIGACVYPEYYEAGTGSCQARGGGCRAGFIFDPNGGCRAPLTSTPGGPGCIDGYISTEAGCVTRAGACAYPQYYDASLGSCQLGGGCMAGYYRDVNSGACKTLTGDCTYPDYYNAATGMCTMRGGGCRVGFRFDPNAGCVPEGACAPGYCSRNAAGDCITTIGSCVYPSYYDPTSASCRTRGAPCADGWFFDPTTGICQPSISLIPACVAATLTPTMTATRATCPPGTYYSETTNGCIQIQIPPTKKSNACSKYGDASSCTSNGCSWNKTTSTCH